MIASFQAKDLTHGDRITFDGAVHTVSRTEPDAASPQFTAIHTTDGAVIRLPHGRLITTERTP